ncbi:MAG: class II glutamine amidotransferase [Desulfobulbaceae bacterium]|nr:class II glutamine amidotransferase [Desulfobulbaceae bacterium]
MCELFAMSSRAPATVSLSLGVLAEHGGKTGPHADGWGIAFYDDNDARVVRDTNSASNSPWVGFVEQQEIRSRFVVSHIRKATFGDVALRNTQPFGRELGGHRHIFAHNGHVPDVKEHASFRLGAYHPIGETDSDHAFCALLERIRPLWCEQDGTPDLASRLDVVTGFARELGELGPANFLYCDGDTLFAHGHRRTQDDGDIRPPGLFWLRRQCALRDPYADTAGVSVTATNQEVMLIASVPLTSEAWEPFAEGDVAAIAGGQLVALNRGAEAA